MKASFLISFFMFLSNINEHFPESNDYNKNTFVNYNIYLQLNDEGDSLIFDKLYNDYGVSYRSQMTIEDLSNIYSITNISQINLIKEDSYILINNKEIFEKTIDKLIKDNYYNYNNFIILLVSNNIFKDLSPEEVIKYKKVTNCFIITTNDSNFDILKKITSVYNFVLNIDLTYKKYNIDVYIICLFISFCLINIILILLLIEYIKINNEHKLGIHIVILFVFILLDICHIIVFSEIIISKESLLYKLIPKEYFIRKVIKNIFFCITKNSIMLIFLLISRAYCILFFDKIYLIKYIKVILLITLIDYSFQFIFKFFDFYFLGFIYIKDVYNILYYILVGIYIYNKGKNISLGLFIILNIIKQNKMRERTEEELNNIKEVVNMKIKIREKINDVCYLFCMTGIISPFIYLLFSSLKGSTIYDLIILFQLSIIICIILIFLYPKELLNGFLMTYEQLINGIPEEFLNEYLFKFSDDYYINNNDLSYIEPNKSPIIIINPFQILENDIKNKDEKYYSNPEINDENDNMDYIDEIQCEIINSFAEKGQIGFWNNTE